MRIAITGGTGFVGKALIKEFSSSGDEIFVLTRNKASNNGDPKVSYIQWLNSGDQPEKELEDIDVFINLAGESINSGRWTSERKQRILNSRLKATEEVLRIIKSLTKKPEVLINASAIGYYGTSREATFTEKTNQSGSDFLAKTVFQWERLAEAAMQLGVRTNLCRFGIILDGKEGALPKIALPYQLFAGGTVGSGEQWLSWIHINDLVKAIIFLINHKEINGPVNFTAPQPVRMKEFGKTLGSVLQRPHWLPAPEFALKIALGEMSILVLEGQKVLPTKLREHGFSFNFNDLESALKKIYSK